jgi:hypothetical protein
MKIYKAKKGEGPRKAGPVRTQQKPLTKASAQRPGRVGQVATNNVIVSKRGKKGMY